MTDPRIAALAEALAHHPVPSGLRYGWSRTAEEDAPAIAAAMLAALPPDWCGHHAALIELSKTTVARDVEIARLRAALTDTTNELHAWESGEREARLRRIEEAARAVADCCAVEESWGGQESDDLCAHHTALRAALEEKP